MRRILLSEIITDADTQVRVALNPDVVADYAERMTESDPFPPVIVFHDDNKYFLADGFHRVAAAKKIDFVDIEADVHEGTRADALWFALGANKKQGQRLSRGDKLRAVKIALNTWSGRTQREIADQVGCAQSYVAQIKAQNHCDNENPAIVRNSRGQNRPASYRKRGAAYSSNSNALAEENRVKAEDESILFGDSGLETSGSRETAQQPEQPELTLGRGPGIEPDRDNPTEVFSELKRLWLAADEETREAFEHWLVDEDERQRLAVAQDQVPPYATEEAGQDE